jgi:hypothetical protein
MALKLTLQAPITCTCSGNIDVGYPDFREANRIYWIFWEACKADIRSFGIIYLKIRRSGFSFMSSSECINIGTLGT